MSPEYIAIVSVILGWFLNELTRRLSRNDERKRKLSEALATCLDIERVIQTSVRSNTFMSSISNDPNQKEKLRSRVAKNLSRSVALLMKEIDEFVGTLRSYMPLDAAKASHLRDALDKYASISLSASAESAPDVFESANTALLAAFESQRDISRSLANKLAWRIGPITYIEVRFRKKRRTVKISDADKNSIVEKVSNLQLAFRDLMNRDAPHQTSDQDRD